MKVREQPSPPGRPTPHVESLQIVHVTSYPVRRSRLPCALARPAPTLLNQRDCHCGDVSRLEPRA